MPRIGTAIAAGGVEEQLSGFITKFEPSTAKLIHQCRKELRKLLPSATEMVYDNYNFFVIGYCSSAKPSSCIVSLMAAANGVGLSFYNGASLMDPERLLRGAGKQNRFIRWPSVELLAKPGVIALIEQAVEQAKVPLPPAGIGPTVIQSVSAKQRPRRVTARGI
jgi:hypothetical protein